MGESQSEGEKSKIPTVTYISNICQLCESEQKEEIPSYVRIDIEPTNNLCNECVFKLRTLLGLQK